MNRSQWGRQVPSFNELCRRAGGRRGLNAWRRAMAVKHRCEIVLWQGVYGIGRGSQVRIVRQMGLHPSTISRHVRAVLRELWERDRQRSSG
jgi:hypothetical protein